MNEHFIQADMQGSQIGVRKMTDVEIIITLSEELLVFMVSTSLAYALPGLWAVQCLNAHCSLKTQF